jgi:hypothetical protein
MTSRKKPDPHTAAWITLEDNLEMVGHILLYTRQEARALEKLANSGSHKFVTIMKSVEGNDPANRDSIAKSITKLTGELKRIETKRDEIMARFDTTNMWQVVMLVTCAEAYLQDVLEAAAALDVDLMNESEQAAKYEDVISAPSLGALALELRRRWARRWLEGGGPTSWITRLTKMGARGYPPDLAKRLELIWGIRHNVVHSAGIATSDLVKRHPAAAKAVGDRIQIPMPQMTNFFTNVQAFLQPTEDYFLKRYPALQASVATKATK